MKFWWLFIDDGLLLVEQSYIYINQHVFYQEYINIFLILLIPVNASTGIKP
jgi:hypothetical protein